MQERVGWHEWCGASELGASVYRLVDSPSEVDFRRERRAWDRADPVVFSPWCGGGSVDKPIPVQTIADYISDTPYQTLAQLSRSDASLEVHTATPRVSSLEGTPWQQQHGMWGCYASKLACRATVPGPVADSINHITEHLESWVASLGAGAAQKCDSLACMRGVHPTTGSRKDVVVLLLMARQQPSMQLYARCAIAPACPEDQDGARVLPEGVPCVVSLRIVESRLSTSFLVVDICSSEELAQQLARSGMSWSIYPLTWHMPEERQLLDHIVTSVGERFVPKKAKKASRVLRPGEEDPVLDDDPLAAGRAAASACRGGASPCMPPNGAAPVAMEAVAALAWDWEDDLFSADGELFGDLPADVAEDLREELFGPALAAEGIVMDGEGGSEGASPEGSQGSSSDAEEAEAPSSDGGLADDEGDSPSSEHDPDADVEGHAIVGPIPDAAAMGPDPVPVLSLSPDGVVCRAQFPHGSLVAYGNTKNMVAECNIEAHGGKCHLTRTLTRGRRAGQGRPLGLLLAWLHDPSIHLESRRSRGWLRPAFAERAAHRMAFVAAPGAEEMLKRERSPTRGEGEEPG